MQSNNDDDFLDIVLAHHSKENHDKSCLRLCGVAVCSRCFGIFLAANLSIFLIFTNFDTTFLRQYYLFFPIFAFLDWGSKRLKLAKTNKWTAVLSGFILGLGVPLFAIAILKLEALTIAASTFYLLLFFFIREKSI